MRLDYREALPQSARAMLGLEKVANGGFADHQLLDLVRLRASQINGCAFCVRLHSDDARRAGEADERLDMVSVWREAECFEPAERAALAWCEAVTRIADDPPADALYEELARHFDPAQIVALTVAIVSINGWNRLNVAFATPAAAAADVRREDPAAAPA